jgi:hypothetical protein
MAADPILVTSVVGMGILAALALNACGSTGSTSGNHKASTPSMVCKPETRNRPLDAGRAAERAVRRCVVDAS